MYGFVVRHVPYGAGLYTLVVLDSGPDPNIRYHWTYVPASCLTRASTYATYELLHRWKQFAQQHGTCTEDDPHQCPLGTLVTSKLSPNAGVQVVLLRLAVDGVQQAVLGTLQPTALYLVPGVEVQLHPVAQLTVETAEHCQQFYEKETQVVRLLHETVTNRLRESRGPALGDQTGI